MLLQYPIMLPPRSYLPEASHILDEGCSFVRPAVDRAAAAHGPS